MTLKSLFAATAALALTLTGLAAEPAALSGAELGKWTMDIPAALELAEKENKPVFINFTGSDWCGWCQMMDKKVFDKPEWSAWTKENMVLLWVDFPRDKNLVPEKLRQANDALSEKYGIQGFPTYVILDPAGAEIGRLGSDRDATPKSFIAQIEEVLILLRLEELLTAEELAEYRALETAKADFDARAKAWMAKVRGESLAFQTESNKIEEGFAQLRARAVAKAKGDTAAEEVVEVIEEEVEE